MPSIHSMASIQIGPFGSLDDDADTSFFDQLGEELDGSLPKEDKQGIQNVLISGEFEVKEMGAYSDADPPPNEVQPEKNQKTTTADPDHGALGLNDALAKLTISPNNSDLILSPRPRGLSLEMDEKLSLPIVGQYESTDIADHVMSQISASNEVQNSNSWASLVEKAPSIDAVSGFKNISGPNLLKSINDTEGIKSDKLSTSNAEGKSKLQTKVTEVQWSKFSHASESDQGGFGSYSDFFSQLSDVPNDQSWNIKSGFDSSASASGSFLTNVDFQTKEQIVAGDLDLLQPLEVDGHHQSQNNRHNIHFLPREMSAEGRSSTHDNHHMSTEYRSAEPVRQENYSSLSGVVNINNGGTMPRYQTSDIRDSCTDFSTVTKDSEGLSQGNALRPKNTLNLENQAWGPTNSIGNLHNQAWGQYAVAEPGNSSQPLETYPQDPQSWGQYRVDESDNGHLYYDSQYPGWCYDYRTQKWHEIPGHVPGGQETSSQDSTTFSIEQNFAVEQGSSQYGTGQVSDPYMYGNFQSDNTYGAVSQKIESFVVDRPQNGSPTGLKQDAYTPASGKCLEADYQNTSTTNFNHSTSAEFTWAATTLMESNQARYVGSKATELNAMNSAFSNHYGHPDLRDPKLLVPTGGWNHAFKSNDITSFNGMANADAYALQYTGYPQHAFSQPVTHTPSRTIQEALRSSAGRPPCSNVAFGFGGKLVILKPNNPLKLESNVGEQSFLNGEQCFPGPIELYNLNQIATYDKGQSDEQLGNFAFANAVSESFSGPLAGGSMSHKDILKWIDEKASVSETELAQSSNTESVRILWGALKIAFQHYGKLRSNPGTLGIGIQGQNGPEAALANLLEPKHNENAWKDGSIWTPAGSLDSLQSLPTDQQLQVTAYDVKRLLIAGKQKEALHCAREGHLWGPALVLAQKLGDKPYADTVADMAHHLFRAGSPLQVLNLLFAGQPSEIFAGKVMSPPSKPLTTTTALGTPMGALADDGIDGLLRQWQENLAMMAANRTNGDEQVIMHLGDCLWERRGEVAAAHTCYLIADAKFECFSNNSRLCLVGADHYKFPRTFASPEAIQRTELYEYSKVMGNSQFILASFQPYKLVYASLLAEVGKVAEASRYCQAVLKTSKTAGRSPEVEACRQFAAALDDRLRIHLQAGNFSNLAPGKLMGRLLNSLDKSIHRMMGAPPPTNLEATSTAILESSISPLEPVTQSTSNILKTSAPSMVPSASMEPIVDSSSRSRSSGPARSASEPNFIKGTKKDESEHGNLERLSSSYFGRFGSQLVKAVGLVVKLNTKEAKLGEKNKFYYDEKLKRWIEEGVDLPPEEPDLKPPPMSKQYSQTDISMGIGIKNNSATISETPSPSGTGGQMSSLGTPPIPPSSNHFSARTRHQGVRSRYVDTFNKTESVGPPKPVQSALLPHLKSGGVTPSKFFVPAPLPVTQLESSFSDQIANENSDHAAVNLPKPNDHTEAHSNQTDSFTSSTNCDPSQSENARVAIPAFNFMTPIAKPIKRISSAEDAVSFDNSPTGSDSAGVKDTGPYKSKKYFPNGIHSRAASWSDYPVSYGLTAENYTHMYPYQASQIIENKQTMKRSLFSAAEVTSSTLAYSYDVHPKPFSGIISSPSLPPPPLLDITRASSIYGGLAPDKSVDQCVTSTPEKRAVDPIIPTDDLQEVEL